jgi:cell division protein YceG involved in septum cleavage
MRTRSGVVSANFGIAVIFGLIVSIFAFMLGSAIFKAVITETTVTNIKVTGKERITVKNGDQVDSKYLIFTENEVFENTDTLFRLKFNSSDLYGKIREGQTCTFVVNGWRVQLLSMYRNILSAECN